MTDTFHLYSDLAWLWPLWGDAEEEYGPYCAFVADLIARHARRPVESVLDIGCGGGKNMLHLKRRFRLTGLDRSPEMLEQARRLNPECAFVEGDMRTFRLGRSFDAILMDDAISHMDNAVDFAAAFRVAVDHLNPGGVLIATPDVTAETFRQNRTTVTPASRGGVDVVFVENLFDPDPSDERYEATILYLIREEGRLRVETDRWSLGLFPIETWRRVFRDLGVMVREEPYGNGEDRYTMFACVKPARGGV